MGKRQASLEELESAFGHESDYSDDELTEEFVKAVESGELVEEEEDDFILL